MHKLIKYTLIAGTGYAIHAALNPNTQSKPKPYVSPSEPTLRVKLANTVSEHIGSKTQAFLFGEPTPPRNFGSRRVNFSRREGQ